MCGRVVQAKGPCQVAIQCGIEVPDTRFANVPPRDNAAPSQELWAIRQNHDTGQRSLDLLTWGLVPHWAKQKPKPPPINAARAKQPYAVGMQDGSAFGLAGVWENWKDPSTGEWVRTFAVITTEANALVAEIHQRIAGLFRAGG